MRTTDSPQETTVSKSPTIQTDPTKTVALKFGDDETMASASESLLPADGRRSTDTPSPSLGGVVWEDDVSCSSCMSCRCVTSCNGACRIKWSVARVLTFTTYALCLVALVATSIELRTTRYENSLHNLGWFIAGCFVILAVPLSIYGIAQHLRNFQNPRLQTYVVRIMWMVPLYAVESWLSLRFKESALTFQTLRDTYEAYVIYCFGYLLIAMLGTDEDVEEVIKSKSSHDLAHVAPFKWVMKPFPKPVFIKRVRRGILQYVVVKLVCTAVTLLTTMVVFEDPLPNGLPNTLYGEGSYALNRFHVYVLFLVNCSQVWAMYCLVLFYHAYQPELDPFKPLPKFICIKAVVFFSFWQEMLIGLLVHFGVIHATENPFSQYTNHDVANGVQDFLICFEMFIASIAHHFAFHYRDFSSRSDVHKNRPFLQAFVQSSLPTDVIEDVRHTDLLKAVPDPRALIKQVIHTSTKSKDGTLEPEVQAP